MARPDRSAERRQEAVGTIAATFAELGYRRTTTAVLAERCGLTEVALYRLWPDKQAMFVAAIRHVGDNTERIWDAVARAAATTGKRSAAERLLQHEAQHLGEFGFHRILFAGYSETDDPAIRDALRAVYERLLARIAELVAEHRKGEASGPLPTPLLTAWALLGLGTATNLGRELGMLGDRARNQLFAAVGAHLLG